MIVVEQAEALIAYRSGLTGSVGFVATMGALHAGHLALIKRARAENDHVIVSVFVNPTQFLPGEDFTRYPRKPEADRMLCRAAGAEVLFMPTPEILYGQDEPMIKAPAIAGYVLEGHVRPGHYDGVLTVVMKLLNLTRPDKAYFGKKDAQQLVLIEQMARAFFMPVQIIGCETERQPNGLALSSRNEYLGDTEKEEALKLSQALFEASRLIKRGQNDTAALKAAMLKVLEPLSVDYAEVTDRNLRPIDAVIKGETLVLIAARVGNVRLIDNMWV